MKLLFVFLILLSLNAQGKSEVCAKSENVLHKNFKFDAKDTKKIDPLITSPADYEKLKKVINEIPLPTATIEKFKKDLSDGVDSSVDTTNVMSIWKTSCVFLEDTAMRALQKYVDSKKSDKNLVNDFEKFVKARVSKQLDTPFIVILLIRSAYLRSLEEIKHGENTPLLKEMSDLSQKMKTAHKSLIEAEKNINLPKDKDFEKLSPEEAKLVVPNYRKELELSEEYSKKIAEFIPKI